MQFKHPELLYALLLLLIPIFIHLFQLRRFQKIDFTNVAFLKKVTIQTRKSSQLKKWITLLLRMLALACIILAFAQPFTASKSALSAQKETVLYIDNSFSMQATGAQGPLLQRSLQDLYSQAAGTEKISWFTNDFDRKNVSVQDFKAEILSVGYSQKQLTPTEVLLKANQLFSKDANAQKRLIYISDFQLKAPFPEIPDAVQLDAVQLKPVSSANISIDSVYVASKSAETIKLNVRLSASGEIRQDIPVSLYNGATLIAKSGVNFSENKTTTLTFDIANSESFLGKLEITEPNLPFDNALYFSVNTPKKIKVLSINEANTNYLQRLFDQPEFDYQQQTGTTLNYNQIPDQNFIVLNELKDIPASLTTALKSFTDNGGSVLIIPSAEAKINTYNALLNTFGAGTFSEIATQEKKITQIVFDHPLFKNVFEKRVVNFQYPKVNSYFEIQTGATPVLRFEDGKPFMLQSGTIYVSTAPINSENSNFQNSPLIVPALYNMAQQSLLLPKLYYTIGRQNNFSVPVQLMQDEILTVKDSTFRFIPLQQTKANKVDITTLDEPGKAGTYQIEKETQFVENISYNFNRAESVLQYANSEDWQGVTTHSNVNELFDSIAEANSIHSFWKWFVIFALLFLVLEMLILKFYK
ncbi:putative membrane protein (TIGR02226 family) [Ulvibacter sp. MAR_2010_11]|uniref:BatA domain-containing protein n=1 Tax=Ulvibacter sp. MAR_2010_11 TaxID=1250229 RepID=UPI000C2C4C3E|nr:BatA domain-containing protein [Ulvibacter sp. MAR_2010_11]PKA84056.1 putative membrane protein (TIGR02226 family) [Ulvibacter sp. MAR_2010_11]